jgi:hypothetical protein
LASEILRDIRALERKIANLNARIEAEVEALGTNLTKIFGLGPRLRVLRPRRELLKRSHPLEKSRKRGPGYGYEKLKVGTLREAAICIGRERKGGAKGHGTEPV